MNILERVILMENNTIHYIWLGKNEKPDIVKDCIKSWKEFFPDWKIVEWNEDNLNIDSIIYCKEAYDKKKYAFVSDYFRFLILYKYGGLYFDTDVKVIKNFSDLIIENDLFFGFEDVKKVSPGLVLYSKNRKERLFKEILDIYIKEKFILENGDLNLKTVVTRFTELLQKYGLQLNNKKQKIKNMTIFPTEYFCPLNYNTGRMCITDKTYAIHLYNGSWLNLEEKKEQEIYRYYYNKYSNKYLGDIIIRNIVRIISIYKVTGLTGVFNRIKKKILKINL